MFFVAFCRQRVGGAVIRTGMEGIKKSRRMWKYDGTRVGKYVRLFYFLYNGLESGGIVHGEVGKDLAVDFDTVLMESAHKLRVGKAFQAGSSIDTLNPEGAEVALLIAAVAIGVGQTFFPSVLGNGPYVFAGAKVATS